MWISFVLQIGRSFLPVAAQQRCMRGGVMASAVRTVGVLCRDPHFHL
ncbi:hypothetical protein EAM_0804 [Erwinia amylovora ATCC 49946]|nr:hypothetical protein EAM_0804 [Erwinia amylovora ATCC 49946]